MEYKLFYGTISPYYQDAIHVRYVVFSQEQGYDASIDLDSVDAYAWHVVIYDGKHAIATARLYTNYEENCYGIGRVAVINSYRGQALGQQLMLLLEEQAIQLEKHREILVHAQVHAIPFYEKLGYVICGKEFLEEGEPHISMVKTLKIRGFEIAKGYENASVVIPVRKTKASAGHDLTIIEDITIPAHSAVLAKTGLKAYMKTDEVLEIYIRSSIAVKQKVWCTNNVGIVDADYYNNPDNDGHIMVPLYNANDTAVTFVAGDRVAQAIFKKYLTVDDEAEVLDTRVGGFGSTTKG